MNNKTLLGIGIAALAIYLFVRRRDKKILKVEDIKAPKDAAVPVVADLKKQLMVDDLKKPSRGNSGVGGRVTVRRPRVFVQDIKVEPKSPIVIAPSNLIPNVYDRGVGQTLGADGEDGFYQNMSGTCTSNIQNACKCSTKKKTDYKLEIPSLP